MYRVMKKLLILAVVLEFAIVVRLMFYDSNNCTTKCNIHDKAIIINDTVINKIRIDSIHILITKQDSIINRINIDEKYAIEKAINSNDSDAIELFKVLVSE